MANKISDKQRGVTNKQRAVGRTSRGVPAPRQTAQRRGSRTGPTPSSSPNQPSSSHSDATVHFAVDIAAHASPRWRGVRSRSAAQELNLQLSKRRVRAVQTVFERLTRRSMAHQKLSFAYNLQVKPRDASTTHVITTDPRGNKDTLKEAHGQTSANYQHLRRVDLTVRLTKMRNKVALSSSSQPMLVSAKTYLWAVNLGLTVSAHLGGGGSVAVIKLRNELTRQVVWGRLGPNFGFGGGVKWKPLSATATWSGYKKFMTDRRLVFSDFHGKLVRLTTAAAGIFYGPAIIYLTIYGVGKSAHRMKMTAGFSHVLGGEAYMDHGNIWLKKPLPPNRYWVDVPRVMRTPYQHDTSETFGHVVYFGTGSAELSRAELRSLRSFVRRVNVAAR